MVSILWFRHGLRLHDNPALLSAISDKSKKFYPVFIFDGESAGTKIVGYNRMRYLLESLQDLNKQFEELGGRLFVFVGNPRVIFHTIWKEIGLSTLCFEQDCEPIWRERDYSVKEFCDNENIQCLEFVSHTLWNPHKVIKTNGGVAPLTYQMFLHTVSTIGVPPRPVEDPDWTGVEFGKLPDILVAELHMFYKVPVPEDFGIFPEYLGRPTIHWKGGERQALRNLRERLQVEESAFKKGFYLPNQAQPDILQPPTSQSAALRFGCLSVRKFYWSVHDLYVKVQGITDLSEHQVHTTHVTGQLIWREYFYTMSVNNTYYGEMKRNPICLDISWREDEVMLKKWMQGQTGYPLIDAAMRQLKLEGWLHHILRNTVATFLTRGDLWISWEHGLHFFLKYLLDADWSVCAGNWMWVSSSAFEQLLDCSKCSCPVSLSKRLDPNGEYVRRYIPELAKFPTEYIFEPWRAPLMVQESAGCIIGKDYPQRIVDHNVVAQANSQVMMNIRTVLMSASPVNVPQHCRPSSEDEVRQFLWLPDECNLHP